MRTDLTNKICLITGGAQGIGWAITRSLAHDGARVYACDISPENIARAHHELLGEPKLAPNITLTQCDVANRAEVEQWITDVHKSHGQIDILINNAAFTRWDDEDQVTIEETEKMMRVGFNGMLYGIKTALPLMKAQGHGHIVNIGSSAGKIFVRGVSAGYAATKAAIDGYTQTLHTELAGSPIHLTLVRFGAVGGTDFFRKSVSSKRMPRLADFIPHLTPQQAANGVLKTLKTRQMITNIPFYLRAFYILFELSPGPLRLLMRLGGSARTNFGAIKTK